MKTMKVSPSLTFKLWEAKAEEVEIYDALGNPIGRFVPVEPGISPEEDLSEEEIEHRLSDEMPTYTTAEVLAYLRGLGK